jgi:GAF domain-containing protein
MDRYESLAHAFVSLADTLVADYDVVELAQQLVDNSMALLPVDAVGIVIVDPHGDLHVLASSSEQTRLLEVFQVQADKGPCLQAYRTGQAVFVDDLAVDPDRWPAFAERATEYGFRAVHALPLRLRGDRIGAANLLRFKTGRMSDTDIAVAQALADVATIGILQQRIVTRSAEVGQQLQTALNTRIIIEQAKGVLAERGGIDMDTSFRLLRSHARRTNRLLAELARAVVEGADTTAILNPGTS